MTMLSSLLHQVGGECTGSCTHEFIEIGNLGNVVFCNAEHLPWHGAIPPGDVIGEFM